jgi:hypothetical protein
LKGSTLVRVRLDIRNQQLLLMPRDVNAEM